ncbi:MAG: hypothetical protein ABII18_12415 [bacterium]
MQTLPMQYQVSNFVNCLGMPDTQAQMRFPCFSITGDIPIETDPRPIHQIARSPEARLKTNDLKSRCARLVLGQQHGQGLRLENDVGLASLPTKWHMTLNSHDPSNPLGKIHQVSFIRKTSFSPISPSYNGPLLSGTPPQRILANALTQMRTEALPLEESIHIFWSDNGHPILTLTQQDTRGLWSRSAILYMRPAHEETALELVWKSTIPALGCKEFMPARRKILSPMDAEVFGRCFAEKFNITPVFLSDYEEIDPVRGTQNTAKFSLFSKRLTGSYPSFSFSACLCRFFKSQDLAWFATMRVRYTVEELQGSLPQHWGLAEYILE